DWHFAGWRAVDRWRGSECQGSAGMRRSSPPWIQPHQMSARIYHEGQTIAQIVQHPDVLKNHPVYQDFSNGRIARGIGEVLPLVALIGLTRGAGAEAVAQEAAESQIFIVVCRTSSSEVLRVKEVSPCVVRVSLRKAVLTWSNSRGASPPCTKTSLRSR